MTVNFRLLISLLILFVAILFILSTKEESGKKAQEESVSLEASPYFDSDLFLKGEADKQNFELKGRIRGVVVPHHMLASKLLSGIFSSLGNYDTVIILGPNHEQEGVSLAYTSESNWNTYFGKLSADAAKIRKLTRNAAIVVNDDIVGAEHSVAVPINYVNRYLPEAKVVPLVLNQDNDLVKITELARVIASILDENTLVVASIDFSHYLNESEARKKDAETLAAIEEKNYQKIASFDSSNLDSSTSIILLDMLMEFAGNHKIEVLVNTNSAEITGYNKEVTSYVVGVYQSD